MELSACLAQELEKVKEDSGEGGAISDPATTPTHKATQQVSNNKCELKMAALHFWLEVHLNLWSPSLTRNHQVRKFCEI